MFEVLKSLIVKAFETGTASKRFSLDLSDVTTVLKRTAIVAGGAAVIAVGSYLSDTYDFGIADVYVAAKVTALTTLVTAWVKDHTK